MEASDLFVKLPPVGKPPKLPVDQFEFAIDRKGRKVASGFDIFAKRETIRVQTNRLFTWWEQVDLPDTSTGMTREVSCVLELEGFVEPNEAAARALLQAALDADFNMDGLIRRLVTDALNRQRASLDGAFLSNMREADKRRSLIGAITGVLRQGGLPVRRVTLQPVQRDERAFLDFEDIPGTLAIRSSGTLEANTVGYKLRLGWGMTEEQRTARLVYRGSIEGRQAGPDLAAPLVPGQVQPLEAWLRTLLAEALAQHPWSAVIAGKPVTLDAVRAQVSAKLGLGTGRVVEALDVLPSAGGQARLRERTLAFQQRYPITGIQGGALEIEHTLGYALKDRDRWVAQGSPHPEDVMTPQVVEATRAFLAGKRFKDVVALYLLGTQGEMQLRDAITSRVEPYASAIGCRLVSTAVILSIPEKDFVEGRRLVFPTAAYSLADPNLAPPMKLSLSVKVATTVEAREAFARALTEHHAFEDRVRTAVLEAVRASLRRVGALSYYASHYVNGSPEPLSTSEYAASAANDDAVMLRLKGDVDTELLSKFGLTAERIDLEPGDDPLIERMKALTRLQVPFDEQITFERGDFATRVTMDATGSIFVVSIDPDNWSSFYNNAARIGAADSHVEQIRAILIQTLRFTQGEVSRPGPDGVGATDFKKLVVQRFASQVRKVFGLLVQIDGLMLRITRPGAGDTAHYILRDLHHELQLLSQQRAQLTSGSTYEDSDRRAAITERIKEVRAEIAAEGLLQEQTIARTETISIEQDRETGLLLGAK